MTVICPVENATTMGGAQLSTLDLIRSFVDLGHTVMIVMPGSGELKDLLPRVETVTVGRETAWEFSKRTPVKTFCDSVRVIFAIRRLCRSKAVSLCYANGIAGCYYSAIGMLMACKRPKVVFHDRGYCCYPNVLIAGIRALTAVGFVRVIATTRGCASRWVEAGVQERVVSTVYNGIRGERYCADTEIKEQSVASVSQVVGMVARFSRNKGHMDFLLAGTLIVKALPNVTLVIVGDVGSDPEDLKYREEVMAAVVRLGLTEHVRFLGAVKYSSMPDVYRSFTVFVNPCRLEPFGRSVVEAMMCRLPVVAVDCGGPAEIVENGTTGFLVKPGSIEEMAGICVELLRDERRRYTVGERASASARERFGWARAQDQTMEICRAMCGRTGDM